MKFNVLSILRNSVEKIEVSLKSDKSNGYFTFRPMYIYHNVSIVLPRVRNVSDKSCRENQNTRLVFSNSFPKIVPVMR